MGLRRGTAKRASGAMKARQASVARCRGANTELAEAFASPCQQRRTKSTSIVSIQPAEASSALPRPPTHCCGRRIRGGGCEQLDDADAEHVGEQYECLDRDVLTTSFDPAYPLNGGVDLLRELLLRPTTRTPQLSDAPTDDRLDLARTLPGQPQEGRAPCRAAPSTYGLILSASSVLLRCHGRVRTHHRRREHRRARQP